MGESEFKIENIHDYFDDFQQSVPGKLQRPEHKITIIYCMFENWKDDQGRFIQARKVIHELNADHGITNRDEFRGWVGMHMSSINLYNLDDIVDFNYPCNEEGQKIVKTTRANGRYYDFVTD